MEFTEEETLCLMEHTPYEQFPDALRHKVNRLGAQEYLGAIPRNLQAIFNQGV
jgi:hypothetical protein